MKMKEFGPAGAESLVPPWIRQCKGGLGISDRGSCTAEVEFEFTSRA